jgi:hypothetical protein
MLGIQGDVIMGGCLADLISPLESLDPCANGGGGGVLEPQFFMVHHTSPRISWLGDRPKYDIIRLSS